MRPKKGRETINIASQYRNYPHIRRTFGATNDQKLGCVLCESKFSIFKLWSIFSSQKEGCVLYSGIGEV